MSANPYIRERSRLLDVSPEHVATSLAEGHRAATQPQIQMTYVRATELKTRGREIRKHSKKHLARIAQSIHQRGFLVPLIVDEERNIVCGVARYLAAQELKLEWLPVIEVGHLTKDQLRAFAIAENKLAEGGEWHFPELAIELSELSVSADLEIEMTGFDTVEIDNIVLGATRQRDAVDAEEIDEPEANPPVSRLGDVFVIGDHRFTCGDGREPEVYARLMEGELARCVFADLPYNLTISNNVSGLGRVRHGEFVAASGELSREEFTRFKSEIMAQLVAHSMPGSIHFIAMDWRHQLEMMMAGEANYSELKNMLAWVKNNAGMGTFYRSRHELIYA